MLRQHFSLFWSERHLQLHLKTMVGSEERAERWCCHCFFLMCLCQSCACAEACVDLPGWPWGCGRPGELANFSCHQDAWKLNVCAVLLPVALSYCELLPIAILRCLGLVSILLQRNSLPVAVLSSNDNGSDLEVDLRNWRDPPSQRTTLPLVSGIVAVIPELVAKIKF